MRAGGGHNHRFALYDGILLKDNHIALAGGISPAVAAARAGAPHTLRIEVEVTDLQQLAEAMAAGAQVRVGHEEGAEVVRGKDEGAARVLLLG